MTLARLGLKWKHEILSLTYEDYDRGPLPDHSGVVKYGSSLPEIDGVMGLHQIKAGLRTGGSFASRFMRLVVPSTLPYRQERKEDTR